MTRTSPKALEYLVGLGFLVPFVGFWQYVNGEADRRRSARAGVVRRSCPTGSACPTELSLPSRPCVGARSRRAGVVTLGLDDFAQQLVGPLAGLDLPRGGHGTQRRVARVVARGGREAGRHARAGDRHGASRSTRTSCATPARQRRPVRPRLAAQGAGASRGARAAGCSARRAAALDGGVVAGSSRDDDARSSARLPGRRRAGPRVRPRHRRGALGRRGAEVPALVTEDDMDTTVPARREPALFAVPRP